MIAFSRLSAIAIAGLLVLPLSLAAGSGNDAEEFHFAVIADSHYCQTENWAWRLFARNCHTFDQRSLREENLAEAGRHVYGELVVHLGDHVEDLTPLSRRPVEKYVRLLEQDFGNVPLYLILGNHDIRHLGRFQHEREAARFFREVTDKPEHSTVHLVDPDGWDRGARASRFGGYLFFGLNSGQTVTNNERNSYINFDELQLANLRAELSKAPPRSVLLFWHVNPRNDVRDLIQGREPKGGRRYLDVLCAEREAIKGVFTGHSHVFDRFTWDCGDGGEGIEFYSCGSTGHPQPGSRDLWMHVKLTPSEISIVNDSSIAWVNAWTFEHQNHPVDQESSSGPSLAADRDRAWMAYSGASRKGKGHDVLVVPSTTGKDWGPSEEVTWSTERPALGMFRGTPVVASITEDGTVAIHRREPAGSWVRIDTGTHFESSSTPALAERDGHLLLVYRDNDGELQEARWDGEGTWRGPEAFGIRSRSGAAAAVFKGKLCVAFADEDEGFVVVCREDGKPPEQGIRIDARITKTPTLAVFEERLYLAYRSETDGERKEDGEIRFGSSADGKSWTIFEKAHQMSSHSPALATLDGRLWLGFTASSSRLLTSRSCLKAPARDLASTPVEVAARAASEPSAGRVHLQFDCGTQGN